LNDEYIIRLSEDNRYFEIEAEVLKAINGDLRSPKVIGYDITKSLIEDDYIVFEKLEALPLAEEWLKKDEATQKLIIKNMSEEVKKLHQTSGKDIKVLKGAETFIPFIKRDTLRRFELAKEKGQINDDLYNGLKEFYDQNHEVLDDSSDFVLTHGDLHFGNLMIDDENNIYIIDYEWATIAPKMFELSKLTSFVFDPRGFLHTSDVGSKYPIEILTVITWLKEFYPELFNEPNLLLKLKVYLIREILWIWTTTVEVVGDEFFDTKAREVSRRLYEEIYIQDILKEIL